MPANCSARSDVQKLDQELVSCLWAGHMTKYIEFEKNVFRLSTDVIHGIRHYI